jgi:hypothetical protein
MLMSAQPFGHVSLDDIYPSVGGAEVIAGAAAAALDAQYNFRRTRLRKAAHSRELPSAIVPVLQERVSSSPVSPSADAPSCARRIAADP